MAKLTKKQKALQGKVDSNKLYPLTDALSLVKECATAKFDESIDVAVQLGIDAKKSDQVVRGAVVMPNGTGKTARVAVFAQGAKADEAKAAGADVVGAEDLVELPEAAAPAYLKDHSWGEVVFDFAWARAYTEHGRAYYPKLLVAAPFTPVPGPRLLVRPGADRGYLRCPAGHQPVCAAAGAARRPGGEGGHAGHAGH